MKWIFNILKNFFQKIIFFPLSKVAYTTKEKFNKPGKTFDLWLAKPKTILFASLFFAIVIFIGIDQKIIVFTENSAEVLKNQTVKVIYNDEAYIIEGIPEFVDVTLIGRRADLIFAKQSASNEVIMDLTGLKPGTHKVPINYNQAIPSIEYSINPLEATIVIYNKYSEVRNLQIDILNDNLLPEQAVITNTEISVDNIVIKSSEEKIKSVAVVKALVDIKKLSSYVEGEREMKNVPLVAYDSFGKIIDVEFVPESVDIKLMIESPSKEVPIKLIPQGELAFGKAIEAIEMDETTVALFANDDILSDINFIEGIIDITNVTTDREYTVELKRPAGVRSLSINSVKVKVVMGESVEKDVNNIAVEYRNLNPEYAVQGLSLSDTVINVGVRGTESVINEIDSTSISAYLDLSGFELGEHEVEIKVEGTDLRATYISKTRKVKIRIIEK